MQVFECHLVISSKLDCLVHSDNLESGKQQVSLLRISPICGIAAKNHIAVTPTDVCGHSYIFLQVCFSNFKQPIQFLVTIGGLKLD